MDASNQPNEPPGAPDTPAATQQQRPRVVFLNYSFQFPLAGGTQATPEGSNNPGQPQPTGYVVLPPEWNSNVEGFTFNTRRFRFPFFGQDEADQKPRASERAIQKLKDLNLQDFKSESCPICFDGYESRSPEVDKDGPTESKEVRDLDDDPPVVFPDTSIQHDVSPHLTDDLIEDPPVAIPEDITMIEDPPVTNPDDIVQAFSDEDPPVASLEEPNESNHKQHYTHSPVRMPCGHVFGRSCINEWLATSNTCPLCRTAVESQDEYLQSTGQAPESTHNTSNMFDVIFNFVPQMISLASEITSEAQHEQPTAPTQAAQASPATQTPQASQAGQATQPGQATQTTQITQTPQATQVPTTDNTSEATNTPADQTPTNPTIRVPRLGFWGILPSISIDTSARRSPVPRPSTPTAQIPAASPRSSTPQQSDSRDDRSSLRNARHHPYDRQVSSNNSTNSLSGLDYNSDSVAHRRDLQCASLVVGLCVGPRRNSSHGQENESDDSSSTSHHHHEQGLRDIDALIRLECGHGYHEPCLQMCMRAHGDRDNLIPTLSGRENGQTNVAWCIRCRRYRDVIS